MGNVVVRLISSSEINLVESSHLLEQPFDQFYHFEYFFGVNGFKNKALCFFVALQCFQRDIKGISSIAFGEGK
jgi:hypothetical protein